MSLQHVQEQEPCDARQSPLKQTSCHPIVPNGGYGWVIVAACCFISFTIDGLFTVFGVLLPVFIETFNIGRAKAVVIGSTLTAFLLMSGPFVSILINWFGGRAVTMVGACILTFGIVISSLAQSVDVLTITFGCIAGWGLGMTYLPSVVMVSQYFDTKRSIANGISTAGSGIGMLVLGPCTSILQLEIGWRNVLYCIGAITLQSVVCGMLMKPLPSCSYGDKKDKILNVPTDNAARTENLKFLGKTIQTTENDELVKMSGSNSSTGDIHKASVRNIKSITVSSSDMEHEPPSAFQGSAKHDLHKIESKDKYISPILPSYDSVLIKSKEPMLQSEVSNSKKDEQYDDKSSNGTCNEPKPHCCVEFSDLTHTQTPPVNKDAVEQTNFGNDKLASTANCSPSLMIATPTCPLYDVVKFKSRDVCYLSSYGEQTMDAVAVDDVNRCSVVVVADVHRQTVEQPMHFSCLLALKEMVDLSLLKSGIFIVITVVNMFCQVGGSIMTTFLVDYGQSLGMGPTLASSLISIFGAANTLGRLVGGFLASFPNVDALTFTAVTLILSGAICFLSVLFATTYTLLATGSFFMGFCLGPFIPLTPVFMVNYLGLEKLTNAFGLLSLCKGVAVLLGLPFAGWLLDYSGTFIAPYAFACILLSVCGLCHLTFPIIHRHEINAKSSVARKNTTSNTEEDRR